MRYPDNESAILEFKQEIPKNEQIIKTVIAFCNHHGGKLVIGVSNDGTVVGVDQSRIQKTMEYLDKSIFEATAPPIIPSIYSQRLGEKLLLIIEVSAGMNKPYYLKSEGLDKGTYIRLGRTSMRANADMIEELKWQSRGKSFDTLPVYHSTLDDLDIAQVESFIKEKLGIQKISLSNDILKSYNIIVEEHTHLYPTVAGVLLFGKRPQAFFPEAFIICSQFSGVSGRNAVASKDNTGTLINQYQQVYMFIMDHLTRSFVIKGSRRQELCEVPEEAIREILMNAIAHRNYNLKAPTKVAIYENRIEIFTPGSFPGPLNVANLMQGITYIRNIAICKILREMGYIEKMGTGFITLFQSYEKRGLRKPEVIEGENYIKCILPRPTPNELRLPFQDEHDDTSRIMNLFQTTTEISVSDIIENLKIPRSTAVRRLGALQKYGVIKRIGTGKGSRYIKK